jgi:hypothetical protein
MVTGGLSIVEEPGLLKKMELLRPAIALNIGFQRLY